MELTDSLKTLLIETAKTLKGSARRLFMARTVKELGPGGQQRAARELRWGRMTIRKGMRELATGVICIDAFALRGRKRISPTSCQICKPSSIARAKPTRSSAPTVCIPD